MEKETIKPRIEMDKSEFLEIERKSLQNNISMALVKNDINTYKNLVQAYERILSLQKDDKWELKYRVSHTENSDGNKTLSLWEEKGSETRNGRKFEVSREIEEIEYELYFDISCNSDGKDTCDIFFDKKVYKVIGDMSIIVHYIINLIDDRNVVVYGDSRAFGMSLLDNLEAKNIKVKRENSIIYRPLI